MPTVVTDRGYNALIGAVAPCPGIGQCHLPFPLGRSGNKIAVWPMTISQRAGVTAMSGGG